MNYRMTRAHAGRLVALSLCTAALSSCSVPGSELGLTAGEPRAVVGAHSLHDDGASMTAEATGELTLSAGQCFELRGPNSRSALLIWPTEAHLLPDGWPGLQVDDEELRVGEQLSISGDISSSAARMPKPSPSASRPAKHLWSMIFRSTPRTRILPNKEIRIYVLVIFGLVISLGGERQE